MPFRRWLDRRRARKAAVLIGDIWLLTTDAGTPRPSFPYSFAPPCLLCGAPLRHPREVTHVKRSLSLRHMGDTGGERARGAAHPSGEREAWWSRVNEGGVVPRKMEFAVPVGQATGGSRQRRQSGCTVEGEHGRRGCQRSCWRLRALGAVALAMRLRVPLAVSGGGAVFGAQTRRGGLPTAIRTRTSPRVLAGRLCVRGMQRLAPPPRARAQTPCVASHRGGVYLAVFRTAAAPYCAHSDQRSWRGLLLVCGAVGRARGAQGGAESSTSAAVKVPRATTWKRVHSQAQYPVFKCALARLRVEKGRLGHLSLPIATAPAWPAQTSQTAPPAPLSGVRPVPPPLVAAPRAPRAAQSTALALRWSASFHTRRASSRGPGSREATRLCALGPARPMAQEARASRPWVPQAGDDVATRDGRRRFAGLGARAAAAQAKGASTSRTPPRDGGGTGLGLLLCASGLK
ncbi:hypothetical protein FB451DRAFT_1377858 [Mycena latifolia]|nr:hypothetical protein FB451DRAFT_1377858 [Mycena latifolia]